MQQHDRTQKLAAYRDKLRAMSNQELVVETGSAILSAAIMNGRRSNNGRDDDRCDACYAEAVARGNEDVYNRGYNDAVLSQGHTGMVVKIDKPLSAGEPIRA